MKGKKYSIGLDLGTNSIGWSVVDSDFSIYKKNGKSLWGVYLFEEGKTAEERRIMRGSRRRYERRKERIDLLQSLLSPAINAVDDSFYERLNLSFLLTSNIDKNSPRQHHYNLFNGDFNDKKFYKKFPTIYHLRQYLCETTEKVDIRLVYLALHHIVKYRGNFLHNENKIVASGDGIVAKLDEAWETHADVVDEYDCVHIDSKKVCEILQDETKTSNDKAKEIKAMLGGNKNFATFVGKVLCGLKGNTKKAFETADEDFEEAKDIQFSKEGYEVALEENSGILGEEKTSFVSALYDVYLEKTFVDILGEGNESISKAMIGKYNKHKSDLADLKQVLSVDRELYNRMFVSKRNKRSTDASYSNYVKINTKTSRYGKTKVDRDAFYKFTKEILAKVEDCELKSKILFEIEMGKFMPKINDISNGAIPYQINLTEMEQIISNQSIHHPILKENKDKIVSLLTFRRPYYVGPLKGKFSWIEQEIKERVYPWNFDKLVDEDEARKNFIKSLVENDSKTKTPKLPRQSITYQKYVVLNELNNLRYKGDALPVEIKQKLFDELVLSKNQVTVKDVVAFLKKHFLQNFDANMLTGFADEKALIGNMKTYRDFKFALGDKFDMADVKLYDKAVEYITVFSDYKSKQKVLMKHFAGTKYTKEDVNRLAKYTYSGWGKYSYEHLAEKPAENERSKSILALLYETKDNYMSIVYDERYGFKDKIVKDVEKAEKVTYDALIEDLYASPSVKKVAWQAVKLVEEIKHIMGCEPEHIFLESTRKPEEKKRTKKRTDRVAELYKAIEKDAEFDKSLVEELKRCEEKELKKEKLYLYMLQLGRCMYTGKRLDLDKLDTYEVDHIVPRSFIKDDSIENKVLVIREANQRKRDLVISLEVRKNMCAFWEYLLKNKFISLKKFDNLRKDQWSESDLHGFINRQLVETNQINKIVGEVLQSTNTSAMVQPVKAAIVTELRKERTSKDATAYGDFFKLRELNDYHHAKDAYLVAVLGIFTNEYYKVWGDDEENERSYYIKKFLDGREFGRYTTNDLVNKRYGIIIDKLMSDCGCLDGTTGEIIEVDNIFETMSRNDIAVVVKKEFEGATQFYKQTLYSGDDTQNKPSIPRKYVVDRNGNKSPLNPELYGGYTGSNQAYYVNVKYGKNKQKLVGVSVLAATQYANGDKDAILRMLKEEGYENPVVLGKPVRYNQLIKMNGQKVLIRSATEVCNATQLVVDAKYHRLLQLIEKDNLTKMTDEDFNQLSKGFVLQYVEKLDKHYPLFGTIKEKVSAFVNDGFDALTKENKAKYIKMLLVITHQGAGRVDVPKEYGGGAGWGRLAGKTIVKDEVEWIDQSMTGYYVTRMTSSSK